MSAQGARWGADPRGFSTSPSAHERLSVPARTGTKVDDGQLGAESWVLAFKEEWGVLRKSPSSLKVALRDAQHWGTCALVLGYGACWVLPVTAFRRARSANLALNSSRAPGSRAPCSLTPQSTQVRSAKTRENEERACGFV